MDLVDQIIEKALADTGGDVQSALRLLAAALAYSSRGLSSGYARLPPRQESK